MNGKAWTAKEEAILRKLYPDTPTKDLATRFGRQLHHVYAKATKLGLKKSAAYMASPAACRLRRGDNVGAANRFPKGHVPANKGLRRPGWSAGRMRETQFKKGQISNTWVPVGTEVVDRNGYRKRKVSDDRTVASRFNWAFVHVLIWEKKHGTVPSGHVVAFRNGNTTDIRIGNLKLITLADNCRRNSIHRLPPSLKKVIYARGRLTRQINRIERRRQRA